MANIGPILHVYWDTNHMLLPGRIYIALSPWQSRDFRNIFLPNIGEDQKKSLPGTASYYDKSDPD